jgi:predicted ATP-dependent serine protease
MLFIRRTADSQHPRSRNKLKYKKRLGGSGMNEIVKMKNVRFGTELFENYHSMTALDDLLCSYKGLPKGVNYMVIGDPGVGKTTVIMDLISNISRHTRGSRVLFISAEMNEIDLAIYVKRYPKFGDLDIMFVEADFEGKKRHLQEIEEVLEQGWDIVAIDSFYELQGIIKEEEDISSRQAETKLLSLIKKHNKADNSSHTNTTFLTIQQVTKKGAFAGTNRLKHMITAMMELRLDNPKNIFSNRYVVFSKHRRGDVGVKLYYSLSSKGDVFFDEEKFKQEQQLRTLQKDVSTQIRDFATQFDELFNKQMK